MPASASPRTIPLPTTPAARHALAVVATLRKAGFAAWWVGGCVRDLLLGLAPKDFDVATDARPSEVAALFPRVVEVGAAFGVVCVLGEGRPPLQVEVATFRADLTYHDGRRPSGVTFVDAEQDVLRRDFTINGLLLDPGTPTADVGEVHDFVGGVADLEARRLRAIGDPAARFGEDALRLLRAVRFAARFGCTIEPETAAAIVSLAPRLGQVSRERIAMELRGMLTPTTATVALALIAELGLAPQVLPEVVAADPTLAAARARLQRWQARAQAEASAGSAAASAGSGLATEPIEPWQQALAVLFWPAGDDPSVAARALAERLRLRVDDVRTLTACWTNARALASWAERGGFDEAAPPAALVRLLRPPHALVELEVAICAGAIAADAPFVAAAHRARAAALPQRWWPRPHVDGATLRARGHAPGPGFAAALAAATDAQLEGADAPTALAVAEQVLALSRG